MDIPYRQIHLDFHTSPYIPGIGSRFDADRFARTLKAARVQSINVFAKDHHGMCYYPTKLGTQHPGLRFDLLGAILEACHSNGISAPVYLPTGWEERAAENQGWLEVSMEGVLGDKRPFESGHFRWRKLCHNKEDYLRYVLAQTDEIIDAYRIDGFFFDIAFQNDCVCHDCIASMKEAGLDPSSERDVRKNGSRVIERFMERVRGHVLARLPEASLYFNMRIDPDGGYDSAYSIKRKNALQTHLEIESLPSGEWGYNHFALCVNYLNSDCDRLVGMTGRFHKSWGDFGSLKNQDALDYECLRMVANGCRCSVGDHMHPSGELDEVVYERIGRTYARIEALEPWLVDSRKVREIAVAVANRPLERAYDSDEGAMRMLLELHAPFDFIDFDMDLSSYKVVVLPDRVTLTEGFAGRIREFLRAGGAVLASGASGMLADGSYPEEFGILESRDNEFEPSYVYFNAEDGIGRAGCPSVFYKRGRLVRPDGRMKQVGAVFSSYFNRSWDRFYGHCQAPFDPEGDMSAPALIEGSGVYYCAYPIFEDYRENGVLLYRDIFRSMLAKALPFPLIEGDLPSTAEVTVWRQERECRTIIHILHYIPQQKSRQVTVIDEKLPLNHRRVALRAEEAPEEVYEAPGRRPLRFSWNPARKVIEIEIDVIDGYAAIIVQDRR
jgi:hypothetical protein